MKIAVAIAATLALAATVTITASVVLWPRSDGPDRPRAVIVDQLALTDPGPAFVQEATVELEEAGYRVDYVPADAVTVDYYRTLPKRGYALIILRSHSSSDRITYTESVGEGDVVDARYSTLPSVGLFTNEVYEAERHVDDQRQGWLTVNSYPERDIDQSYFGISPEFIAAGTEGLFKGTTVILMGCAGLSSESMAEAFSSKGAGVFISWDGFVTAQHTDKATGQLLDRLIGQRLDPADAVAQAMAEVGPDPAFGARLLAYP